MNSIEMAPSAPLSNHLCEDDLRHEREDVLYRAAKQVFGCPNEALRWCHRVTDSLFGRRQTPSEIARRSHASLQSVLELLHKISVRRVR